MLMHVLGDGRQRITEGQGCTGSRADGVVPARARRR